MAPTPSSPAPRRITTTRQYTLLISIYASQYQSGTALTTSVLGPYDTMEQCQEAGQEAKENFQGHGGSLFYTCVPTYKKAF